MEIVCAALIAGLLCVLNSVGGSSLTESSLVPKFNRGTVLGWAVPFKLLIGVSRFAMLSKFDFALSRADFLLNQMVDTRDAGGPHFVVNLFFDGLFFLCSMLAPC